MHKNLHEFEFQPDLTTELRTLERLKNLYNVVNTGSSSFLQVTRTTIKSRMSKKFCQIQAWTAE